LAQDTLYDIKTFWERAAVATANFCGWIW